MFEYAILIVQKNRQLIEEKIRKVPGKNPQQRRNQFGKKDNCEYSSAGEKKCKIEPKERLCVNMCKKFYKKVSKLLFFFDSNNLLLK